MAFVLDASVAAVWYLPGEGSRVADVALDRLVDEPAIVPRLFWYEIRNILVIQERRGRLDAAGTTTALSRLADLPIGFAEPNGDVVLALARTHRLTAHDASYLGLAVGARLALATLDRELASAARRAGVDLLKA